MHILYNYRKYQRIRGDLRDTVRKEKDIKDVELNDDNDYV